MQHKLYLAATLFISALMSCNDSEFTDETTSESIIPVLTTEIQTSRTIINEESGAVNWDANDKLTVFVHESGKTPNSTSDWQSSKYKFVTNATDCKNNIFKQEVGTGNLLQLDPNKAYDWYVMAPYSAKIVSPADNLFSIGDQTQDMSQPTAHLTSYDIMTGVSTGKQANSNNAVAMKHLATLMKFSITNNYGNDIIPESIEFEAISQSTCALGGDFQVDFSQSQLVPTSTTRSKIILNLEQNKSVKNGEAFNVYAIMAPFTLETGDQFKITVKTDKGESYQISQMKQKVTFDAGTINRAKVKVSAQSGNTTINPWEQQGEWKETIIP